MAEQPVRLLDDRASVREFEAADGPKVVCYLDAATGKPSSAHRRLLVSAMHYQEIVPHALVTDAALAKGLKLRQRNQCVFLKPYERPITAAVDEIMETVRVRRSQFLTQVFLHNMYDTWSADDEGRLIVAILQPKTTDGTSFLAALRSLARTYYERERLKFIWLDADKFSMLHQRWQAVYGLEQPDLVAAIGALNMRTVRGRRCDRAAWR